MRGLNGLRQAPPPRGASGECTVSARLGVQPGQEHMVVSSILEGQYRVAGQQHVESTRGAPA